MSTLTELFTDIANAIRTKKGTSALINAEDFPDEISSISGGGGDSPITQEEYEEDLEIAQNILAEFVPYQELEYVQSTGTQYFNTNYFPNQNTKIVLKMETMGMISGQTQFNAFGTTDDTSGSASRFGWWTYYSGTSYFRYGVQSASRDSKINVTGNFINTLFTVTLDSLKAIIETSSQTVEYNVPATTNFTLGYSLVLGGSKWNNGGTIGNYQANYKLYSCKIYENDVLIHDWIPAIDKLNNVVCLYDKVDEEFLYGSGTENFIAGGVVNV
jgi:hypothetical protein